MAPTLLSAVDADARESSSRCILTRIGKSLLQAPKTERGYVDLSTGRRVFFDHRVSGRKPTVLLVHGLAEDSRSWDGVADRLERQGYSTIRMDLHGHGRTLAADLGGNAEKRTIEFRHNVEDLIALLKWRGVEDVYLVGHSMGGAVAAELAATPRLPFKLRGLNLNAPYTYRLDSLRAQMPQAALAESWMNLWVPRSVVDLFTDPFFVDPFASSELRRHIEKRYRRANGLLSGKSLAPAESSWIDEATAGAIRAMKGIREVNLTSTVPKIQKIPVTINTGADDRLVPESMHQELYRHFQSRKFPVLYNVFEGSDHFMPETAPEKLFRSIVRDLEERR